MTRDSRYYEDRLEKIAKERYAKLTEGKSEREIFAMDEELEEKTFVPALTTRIAYRLPEARAYVEALEKHADVTDPSAKFPVLWISTSSQKMPFGGEMMRANLTRGEMLALLEEISSDSFGDDLAEWRSWLDAWEADPPPRGYR